MSPRDRILARRAKFIAAAFVGIAGCSSETSPQAEPQPCLSQQLEDTGIADTRDAADAQDTTPMPCLTAPLDTGVEDSSSDATSDSTADTGVDTGPLPCLVPPLDSGT